MRDTPYYRTTELKEEIESYGISFGMWFYLTGHSAIIPSTFVYAAFPQMKAGSYDYHHRLDGFLDRARCGFYAFGWRPHPLRGTGTLLVFDSKLTIWEMCLACMRQPAQGWHSSAKTLTNNRWERNVSVEVVSRRRKEMRNVWAMIGGGRLQYIQHNNVWSRTDTTKKPTPYIKLLLLNYIKCILIVVQKILGNII